MAQSCKFFKTLVYDEDITDITEQDEIKHFEPKRISPFKQELQQALLNYLLKTNMPPIKEIKRQPSWLARKLTENAPNGMSRILMRAKTRSAPLNEFWHGTRFGYGAWPTAYRSGSRCVAP